ncbi:MAG: divalent-cation tolerance protein CutA [Terriglobales bacterium]|jgi:periplasmic divalent cation tolerance protein
MTDKRLIMTTASSEEEARRIGNALVEKKLAACVSIVSKMESIYTWNGNTQESQELLILIKTTAAAFERVRDAIKGMHSYEVPEVLSFAIDDGNPEYLDWIGEAVK